MLSFFSNRFLSGVEPVYIQSIFIMRKTNFCFFFLLPESRYGRKFALLSSVIPFLLGWILVATGSSLAQLYVARLIFGFAVGFCFTALPMYVGEIAEVI